MHGLHQAEKGRLISQEQHKKALELLMPLILGAFSLPRQRPRHVPPTAWHTEEDGRFQICLFKTLLPSIGSYATGT